MDTAGRSAYTWNVARQTAGFYQRYTIRPGGRWEQQNPRSKDSERRLRKGVLMAKDGPRIIVKMESSAGTGFYYTTTKNRRNTQAKMELRKYDPVAKKHVVFKEKKV